MPKAGDIRDMGLIPGSARSLGGGHGNPLQYSCLGNPMDRGAWRVAVHRITQRWTRLKRLSMHVCLGKTHMEDISASAQCEWGVLCSN